MPTAVVRTTEKPKPKAPFSYFFLYPSLSTVVAAPESQRTGGKIVFRQLTQQIAPEFGSIAVITYFENTEGLGQVFDARFGVGDSGTVDEVSDNQVLQIFEILKLARERWNW